MDRAFHRKVELPLLPHVDGRVPAFGKTFGASAFAIGSIANQLDPLTLTRIRGMQDDVHSITKAGARRLLCGGNRIDQLCLDPLV
jgi:hypothetical protein